MTNMIIHQTVGQKSELPTDTYDYLLPSHCTEGG